MNKNAQKTRKLNPTRTRNLVIFAILTAIIVLMAFTPVGYLRVGVIEITFIMIPVIIGAAVLGPLGGLGLGFVFGMTSFLQCFGISAGGTMMFNMAPLLTTLTCLLPRILFGFVSAYIYKLFKKLIKVPVIPEALTMVLSSVIHTVMFVLLFYACFRNEEFLKQYGDTFFAIVWAMVGINAIVEWAVCGVFGTAILKTLTYFINRYDKKKAAKNENAETSENADENEDDFEQFTAPINSETPFDNQDDSDFETQEENEDISKE